MVSQVQLVHRVTWGHQGRLDNKASVASQDLLGNKEILVE